ncbi:hypothetical protein KP509_18G085000 [Ceratopteris richardii]|uniref:Uncharacterized protein n=1 Tax=Ceratopteris richardii TaxID=49495 RepID=A0A8T2SV82_CERRI|nr:hypothetical protein KP509_18G085000 [Ceratopteris richardii]
MCYEVKCTQCGKTTWGGCGRHVRSVYNKVPESQRCICKAWPGVGSLSSSTSMKNRGAPTTTSTTKPARLSSSRSCAIM